jgi:F-type H+-transporting ATPase subunit epsilon
MPTRLEIVTAEGVLFEGDVESIVAPGGEGELGILPHHAALMTTLQPGELRYTVGGVEAYATITGGFMDVRGDQVVVLADAAEHVTGINEERAEQALSRARERIAAKGEDLDLERALRSLRRAQARLDIVRRRVRRGPGAPERRPNLE